jgi:hypothetical protein
MKATPMKAAEKTNASESRKSPKPMKTTRMEAPRQRSQGQRKPKAPKASAKPKAKSKAKAKTSKAQAEPRAQDENEEPKASLPSHSSSSTSDSDSDENSPGGATSATGPCSEPGAGAHAVSAFRYVEEESGVDVDARMIHGCSHVGM